MQATEAWAWRINKKKAWKRYPFRAESPRTGKYGEYCIYSPEDDIVSPLKQKFPKTFQFTKKSSVVSKIKSPLCCQMTII